MMSHLRLPQLALLLAWLAGAAAPLLAQPVAARGEAVLVLPAEPVQLGTFRTNESRTARFRIRNNTQDPIRIGRVRAGCTCTAVVSHTQTPIAQGASGDVELTILGRQLPEGPFARTAFVELENSPVPSVLLRYAGTIVCPVRVTPGRDLFVGDVAGTDANWQRTFELEPGPGETRRIELGEPMVTGPATATLSEKGRNRFSLVVRAEAPVSGPFNVEVQIPVLEPEGVPPEVITVRGHIGARLVVEPAVLDIPEGATPLRRELHLSLPNGAGATLNARELTILVPPGVTARAVAEPDGVVVLLQISPEARRAGIAGVVEISSKTIPAVRIPYYVMQPPRRLPGRTPGATGP